MQEFSVSAGGGAAHFGYRSRYTPSRRFGLNAKQILLTKNVGDVTHLGSLLYFNMAMCAIAQINNYHEHIVKTFDNSRHLT